MHNYLSILAAVLLLGCSNANRPLTNNEKDKICSEAKGLIGTIFQACENCDAEKLTATYLDSPDFFSFINGEFANYEETVKKYPVLMKEFKTQKATIVNEKYIVLDASKVLYTSISNWECKFQNDSMAVFNNCKLEFLLKKVDHKWKILGWTEAY